MISLAALIFAQVAEAENVCVSYFAAQGFTSSQCNAALKVFDGANKPCMSVLWRTFDRKGRSLCTQRFLRRFENKPHTLQIHFSDETARRSNRFYPGAVNHTLTVAQYNRALERKQERVLKRIRQRALSITAFIDNHAGPNTEVILSTGLEDNYTNKAYRVLYREIKKTIPYPILISRNPVGTNENAFDLSGAEFIELHSIKPRFTSATGAQCVASLDGYRIDFDGTDNRGVGQGVLNLSDVSDFVGSYTKRGCLVFLWWPGTQGRGEARFVEPRSRSFRVRSQDVSAMNKILRRFQP